MIPPSGWFKHFSIVRDCFIAIVLVLLWLGSGKASYGQERQADHKLRRAAPALAFAKAVPAYQNLDSGLNQILADPSPAEKARRLGFRTRDDQIQVVVTTRDGATAEVMAWLDDGGATGVMSAGNLVEAFVSPQLLEAISGDERVFYVRKPIYVIPDPESAVAAKPKVGTQTSEGVTAMNADEWHSAGVTGQGKTVAVIDGGFEGAPSLVGSDLPADRTYWQDFSGMGLESGGEHGTACAEIVYDVVPGLTALYLFVVATDVQIVSAINRARLDGIDVVSMSLGHLGWGPGDGTGLIPTSIDAFVDSGGIFSTSAGNARVSHWQGGWNDSDSDNLLNFATGFNSNYLTEDGTESFWVPAGTSILSTLIWNQWSAPTTDLDLAIIRWDGTTQATVVKWSEDLQNGTSGQRPVEEASYANDEGGYYGVMVRHYSGPTSIDIELTIRPDLPLEDFVVQGSLLVPGDTKSAISVAALDAAAPYELQYYSSRGPTNGPGGSIAGGYVKPDFSGYASVSTATYSPEAFPGTSAACPHVAGAAALVWSANPGWTKSEVRSYLESHAIDQGLSGKDNNYGFGRLYIGSPAASCTYSISPTSQSFGSSGGSGSFNVNTQSGCTWTSSTSKSWIHITGGSSGNGNGTVTYTIDANSNSSQRSGAIQAAGKTFSITQSGAGTSCTYSISPTSRSFGANGGTGTVSVSTASGCSWTATSNSMWMDITDGRNGSGNGTVSYRVYANTTTSSRSGSMTVAGGTFSVSQAAGTGPPSGEYVYYSVIAHTTGSLSSLWVSSMSLCNLSSSTANAALTYQYGSGNTVEKTVSIPPNGIVEWLDTASDLFGVSGKSSGVVDTSADVPLHVAVRTFNSSDIGTYGQSLPGATVEQSMTEGEPGTISPVKRTPDFRTNIGFINTGKWSCSVETTFIDGNGSQIGSPVTVNLESGEWKQQNDILGKAGIEYASLAYAVMKVNKVGAFVWAYATVIDNATGDPTGLPLVLEP